MGDQQLANLQIIPNAEHYKPQKQNSYVETPISSTGIINQPLDAISNHTSNTAPVYLQNA